MGWVADQNLSTSLQSRSLRQRKRISKNNCRRLNHQQSRQSEKKETLRKRIKPRKVQRVRWQAATWWKRNAASLMKIHQERRSPTPRESFTFGMSPYARMRLWRSSNLTNRLQSLDPIFERKWNSTSRQTNSKS